MAKQYPRQSSSKKSQNDVQCLDNVHHITFSANEIPSDPVTPIEIESHSRSINQFKAEYKPNGRIEEAFYSNKKTRLPPDAKYEIGSLESLYQNKEETKADGENKESKKFIFDTVSPLEVTNISDYEKTPEKMILPPLLSSGCGSAPEYKDFNNDVHFDSNSKDKHVKPFGYDSLRQKSNDD